MIRTFCISSELFQGFKVDVDIDEMESMENIINYVKNSLCVELEKLQLERLVSKLNKTNFCHHGYDIMDVLVSEKNDRIWYLCDHCKGHDDVS